MKCVLTFSDGKILTAEIPAGAATEPQTVSYSGATERIKTRPTSASPGFLEWYFKAIAAMADANAV